MPQMATQIIMLKVKEDCRQILYHYYIIFMKISIPLKYWVKNQNTSDNMKNCAFLVLKILSMGCIFLVETLDKISQFVPLIK